ncbi:hypothetical protein MAR_012037 [Mya arenaria]|uniref:Uncharacterized protein n=1 Tax=Mya arenaria TaxID=6604 RepID=A0ABY7FZK7_MYAAR|nr:hypothetical protein MAR_012037 [Mya arenaria]
MDPGQQRPLNQSSQILIAAVAPLKTNVWLEKLWGLLNKQELTKEDFVSWSEYHAYIQHNETAPSTIEALMSLFLAFAHSDTIVKHSMNVVKTATENLNTGQNPVLATAIFKAGIAESEDDDSPLKAIHLTRTRHA